MKKIFIKILFFLIAVAVAVMTYWPRYSSTYLTRTLVRKNPPKTDAAFSATPTPIFSRYANQKYGFSIEFPAGWSLPTEKEILPPQEHVLQIIFYSGDTAYFVDVFDQMTPVTISAFLRQYFQEGDGELWIEGGASSDGVKFYLNKPGLGPKGFGGFAFSNGKSAILISTSILFGDRDKILADEGLAILANGFRWNSP